MQNEAVRRYDLPELVVLVAAVTIIPLVVAFGTVRVASDVTDRLQREQDRTRALALRLDTQTQKLCIAIHGAVEFWVLVRRSEREILKDPTLTPTARKSNEQFVIALNGVITRGNALACHPRAQ